MQYFEVYRDTNGNKELDKEDELLGVMEETDPGQYEMKDLLYGGVLIKEKTAPDGFYLDENTYYVMIDTDGKTYEVENEAGKGFYNEAFKGNLKIGKTSSDGKVEASASALSATIMTRLSRLMQTVRSSSRTCVWASTP